MSNPFGVSVVMPAFNRSTEVLRGVDSIGSVRPDIVEIIVIDDASAIDISAALPKVNAHGIAVRAFRFDRNRGPQAARNLGIRRARFSYIAFLDSDDEFRPDKIDKVLSCLESHEVDVLFHAADGMGKYNSLNRFWNVYLRPVVGLRWWAAAFNPVVTPTLVVRRRIRLGLPTLRHCEDYSFLLRYCEPDVEVVYLEEALSKVNRRPGTPGGLSGSVWRMRRGECAARSVLLKARNVEGLVRYLLGGAFWALRIVADTVRLRYWR